MSQYSTGTAKLKGAAPQSSPLLLRPRAASDFDSREQLVRLLEEQGGPEQPEETEKAPTLAPRGVSLPLYAFFSYAARNLDKNDKRLWPFVNRLLGSSANSCVESTRIFRLTDWAVREVSPLALEANGLLTEAASLRQLAPVNDESSADAARIASDSIASSWAGTRSVFAASWAAKSANNNSWTAGIYAEIASERAIEAGADREILLNMQVVLLDELCPPPC